MTLSGHHPARPGARLGHEFIGIVESVGEEVTSIGVGDLVVTPFQWSDNTCPACLDGLQTSCVNGGKFGALGTVPEADGTLVAVAGGLAGTDESLLTPLLELTDVVATGFTVRSSPRSSRAPWWLSLATARLVSAWP